MLTMLCWSCRAATVAQLAAAAGVSVEGVNEALRSLMWVRLASVKTVSVATITLREPLSVWRTGLPAPDFGHLAWTLEFRWQTAQRRPERIVWATGLAPRIVGGVGGQLRQPLQLEHDLGLTDVFVGRSRDDAAQWLSEDAFRAVFRPTTREKIPDAVLVNGDGRVETVIEFGGRYSHRRLRSFHRYWSGKRVAYEIW
jgi:hypothetical protein